MAGFNAFNIATLGMMAQSFNLEVIGQNISNATTGGYKRDEARFQTVLSDAVGQGNQFRRNQDNGGVRSYAINTIDGQGILQQTNRSMDLGIAGDGFFILNTSVDGSGQARYGRDGSFQLVSGETTTATDPFDSTATIEVTQAYLADKNGYVVLGYAVNSDGTVNSSGDPVPMRLDQFAFADDGVETTRADLDINLTASDNIGDNFSYQLNLVDSAFNSKTVSLLFTNAADANSWHVTASGDNATTISLSPTDTYANNTGTGRQAVFSAASNSITVTPDFFNGLQTGDTLTVANSTNNNGTYTIASVSEDGSSVTLTAPGFTDETSTTDVSFGGTKTQTMVFGNNGVLESPTEYSLSVTWDDGATSTVTIDVADFAQYSGDFTVFGNNTDGFEASEMESFSFDADGNIVGFFNNGNARTIYQVPLALFSNPNGLEPHNGNVYAETTDSGEALTRTASETDAFSFNPNSVELSNVDLADEMTRMIVAQNAYNSNAMVFRTTDEMVEVARDLKR